MAIYYIKIESEKGAFLSEDGNGILCGGAAYMQHSKYYLSCNVI